MNVLKMECHIGDTGCICTTMYLCTQLQDTMLHSDVTELL